MYNIRSTLLFIIIKKFKFKQTVKIFNMENFSVFPNELNQRAYNKLHMLHNASIIRDLCIPPSNNLEKFKIDRVADYSIRINSQ